MPSISIPYMHSIIANESFVCSRCIARSVRDRARARPQYARRTITTTPRRLEDLGGKHAAEEQPAAKQGAMSSRLEQMTEESLEEGGRGARKAIRDAGFSEELKRKLEARIAEDASRKLDPTASAVLSMPESAGPSTRDAALATPWSGIESIEDATLRMLNDAHKPLRGGSGGSSVRRAPRAPPMSVDMRMKKALKSNRGERLANARDKTSIYAISKDPNMSEKEKEDFRKIMRERFQPGSRPMPTTLQGLSSLANERIEDAINRGQFKNIPRGKGVGKTVDHNANSPFINTTEYFMNKMIQRQDIVPPWIEKQQDVVKTAGAFRQRLRNDWKRHAARVIASKGGNLQDQIRRAQAYAAAEAKYNPRAQKSEALSQVDSQGNLSQINVIETLTQAAEELESKITVVETPPGQMAADVAADVAATTSVPTETSTESTSKNANEASTTQTAPPQSPPPEPLPNLPPFRDPDWERIELPYHRAALKDLNSLTRSYNLMAPELAKKPYYNLERELNSCFADVASQLPDEIRDRAMRPTKIKVEIIGHRPGSVLERFGGETAKVYDSRKPNYGFKDFWRELWNSGEERRAS